MNKETTTLTDGLINHSGFTELEQLKLNGCFFHCEWDLALNPHNSHWARPEAEDATVGQNPPSQSEQRPVKIRVIVSIYVYNVLTTVCKWCAQHNSDYRLIRGLILPSTIFMIIIFSSLQVIIHWSDWGLSAFLQGAHLLKNCWEGSVYYFIVFLLFYLYRSI